MEKKIIKGEEYFLIPVCDLDNIRMERENDYAMIRNLKVTIARLKAKLNSGKSHA